MADEIVSQLNIWSEITRLRVSAGLSPKQAEALIGPKSRDSILAEGLTKIQENDNTIQDRFRGILARLDAAGI